MSDMSADSVQDRLGLSGRYREWLEHLPIPLHAPEPALPGNSEADALLHRLGVQPHDRARQHLICHNKRMGPALDVSVRFRLRLDA
jgi:hypothetical protein